jgi:predicted dehydrogenase
MNVEVGWMGLRIGVIGVGKLGRHHVRVLSGLGEVEFVGCHDQIADRARSAAEEFGATAYGDRETLIADVDAVDIVVPTSSHAKYALMALDMGRDLFVEKPLAGELEEAAAIVERAEHLGRLVQVGHSERFNGAFEKVRARISNPTFVEIHRLAPFSVRGTDISVVGDLMIHDLDLLNCLLGEEPVEIRAKGAGVLTEAPDIVNARLEYASGCVANVTASRVSVEPMRKLRVFCPNRYISVDMQAGRATEYRKADGFEEVISKLRTQSEGYDRLALGDFIQFETFTADGTEPLQKELREFCRCVEKRETPSVSGADGLNAVRLAAQISSIVRQDAAAA